MRAVVLADGALAAEPGVGAARLARVVLRALLELSAGGADVHWALHLFHSAGRTPAELGASDNGLHALGSGAVAAVQARVGALPGDAPAGKPDALLQRCVVEALDRLPLQLALGSTVLVLVCGGCAPLGSAARVRAALRARDAELLVVDAGGARRELAAVARRVVDLELLMSVGLCAAGSGGLCVVPSAVGDVCISGALPEGRGLGAVRGFRAQEPDGPAAGPRWVASGTPQFGALLRLLAEREAVAVFEGGLELWPATGGAGVLVVCGSSSSSESSGPPDEAGDLWPAPAHPGVALCGGLPPWRLLALPPWTPGPASSLRGEMEAAADALASSSSSDSDDSGDSGADVEQEEEEQEEEQEEADPASLAAALERRDAPQLTAAALRPGADAGELRSALAALRTAEDEDGESWPHEPRAVLCVALLCDPGATTKKARKLLGQHARKALQTLSFRDGLRPRLVAAVGALRERFGAALPRFVDAFAPAPAPAPEPELPPVPVARLVPVVQPEPAAEPAEPPKRPQPQYASLPVAAERKSRRLLGSRARRMNLNHFNYGLANVPKLLKEVTARPRVTAAPAPARAPAPAPAARTSARARRMAAARSPRVPVVAPRSPLAAARRSAPPRPAEDSVMDSQQDTIPESQQDSVESSPVREVIMETPVKRERPGMVSPRRRGKRLCL